MNIDYALSREKRSDFRYRLKRRTREVLRVMDRYKPSPHLSLVCGDIENLAFLKGESFDLIIFLLNHLRVTLKAKKLTGLKDEDHTIPR